MQCEQLRETARAHVQEKNVSREMLDGKVGRMYVPRQELGSIATRKMKVRASLSRMTAALRSCCCLCSARLRPAVRWAALDHERLNRT